MSRAAIATPAIFAKFPEIIAGITLRDGQEPPYTSSNFGYRALEGIVPAEAFSRAEHTALQQRTELAHLLLGAQGVISIGHQTHSAIVVDAPTEGDIWGTVEADGLISGDANNLLAVLVADCAGILLYDPETNYIGAVHSGWRGTRANIVGNTVAKLQAKGVDPANLRVYISPVACPKDYEVGPDFRQFFATEFLPVINGRVCFDNVAAITKQLREAGVQHIEADTRCTVEDRALHSYRRDGKLSGRMAVFIGRR